MAKIWNFKVMNKFGRFSYSSHILQILTLSSQQNQSPLPLSLLFGRLAFAQRALCHLLHQSWRIASIMASIRLLHHQCCRHHHWYDIVRSYLYGKNIMVDINRQTLIMKKSKVLIHNLTLVWFGFNEFKIILVMCFCKLYKLALNELIVTNSAIIYHVIVASTSSPFLSASALLTSSSTDPSPSSFHSTSSLTSASPTSSFSSCCSASFSTSLFSSHPNTLSVLSCFFFPFVFFVFFLFFWEFWTFLDVTWWFFMFFELFFVCKSQFTSWIAIFYMDDKQASILFVFALLD